MVDAFRLSWICDDAFLSFRYAEHLAQGKGLVFNEGEYVEGYSNFLWTVFLAIGMALGIEPEGLSIVMGLIFFSGTLFLLSSIGRGMLAPLCVGSIYHMRVYATSGLESSLFWFLIVGVFVFLESEKRNKAALFVFLAILCRPEGMVLLPLSLIFLRSHHLAFVYRTCIPVALYFLWKYWYFGDWLPNTYWAKGNEIRWEQGLQYMYLFWSMYGLGLFGLLSCAFVPPPQRRFLLGAVVIISAQLVKGGGGFMFARLALPILLLSIIGLEVWASDYLSKKRYAQFALLMGGLFFFSPYPPQLKAGMVDGIVEEKDWYPVESVEHAQFLGSELREYIQDTDARVAILGAQAMVAYYSKAPYILESMAGLTDKELARMPANDMRIGHGRKASLSYMRSRNIDILLTHRNPMSAPDWAYISMGSVQGVLITYRPTLMDTLQSRGAYFTNIQEWMDTRIQEDISKQGREVLFEQMIDFYLIPSADSQRLQSWERWKDIVPEK